MKKKKKKVKSISTISKGVTTIHGRNVDGYLDSLSIPQEKRLEERIKKSKKNVLDCTTDDAGNIDFFLNIYGDYILYDSVNNVFYYYTGLYWKQDLEKRVEQWAQEAMMARRDFTLKKLKKITDASLAKRYQAHADKCCNQRSIKALIEGVKARVAFNPSRFKKNRHLLNCLNGTIDLRTGELKQHSPRHYISNLIPFEYEKGAKRDKFKIFIKEILPDKDIAYYMKILLGYCLTGETSEQSLHFLLGTGANGKSTLLETIAYIIKGYAEVIPSKVLTSYERFGSASPELAQLEHKRLVCCSELNCTDNLNEGKIKVISSGETISVRQLYGTPFTYEPKFKFLIDTNYLPQISGTDHGIWRRIRVIPFEHTVAPDKIDKTLKETLKSEAKGILAWMIEGAYDYYHHGLPKCEAVEKATKQYRRSQDTLGSFVEACIVKKDDKSVRARTLYEAYCRYCDDNFLNAMSETKFGKDFAALGYKKGKDKISRKYLGIKLKSESYKED